jgi:hypothetical protein
METGARELSDSPDQFTRISRVIPGTEFGEPAANRSETTRRKRAILNRIVRYSSEGSGTAIARARRPNVILTSCADL